MQNKLYAVGREANRFVVTVTGVKSDTDWFNNSYESRGQASGIIIADNGQELLILTERKVISDAQEVYVTFINDVTVEASMKHYDGNTGIAVLSVPKEQVDTDTMNAISVAKLGNSLTTMQGTMVIAVGSPLGTNYSILTGNITSTNNVISTIDNNYTVFTTDIVGSSSGSGAADGQERTTSDLFHHNISFNWAGPFVLAGLFSFSLLCLSWDAFIVAHRPSSCDHGGAKCR